MVVIANRRSVMTLFSDPMGHWSHRARLALAEKGINCDFIDVVDKNFPEDLLDLNPYNTVPTLVDRELVLYDSRVIIEYLDERFPHPPLMPVDPVTRAQFRLALYRIEKDWYSILEDIGKSTDRRAINRNRKILRESIVSSAEIFAAKKFFLSNDFSLVDCTIAPILWRLPTLDIELPDEAQPILQYMDVVFARSSFQTSLTEPEREMRE